MLRWLAAFALIALTGAAWFGLARGSTGGRARGDTDEIRAYELAPGRPLTLTVPAGVERMSITTWAVVSPTRHYDPAATYAYGIEVTRLRSESGAESARRHHHVSRIGADPRLDSALSPFVARLADSGDWVTDPRTAEIEIDALARGERLALRALPGAHQRLLARITFAERRRRVERDLLLQSLGSDRQSSLIGQRTSLGYADLPPSARVHALESWQRRVPALGHLGHDYVERRLLLGDHDSSLPPAAAPDDRLAIDPRQPLILNVAGRCVLRVESSAATTLLVSDGGAAARALPLAAGDPTELTLEAAAPRSIELVAREATWLRLRADPASAAALLGDPPRRRQRDGRISIEPELRRERCFFLRPEAPLELLFAPGQPLLGLTLRGALGPEEQELAAELSARFVAGNEPVAEPRRAAPRTTSAPVSLARSRLDVFSDGRAASEPRRLFLRPAPGALGVELRGDARLCVLPWTNEPGVAESRLAPAYAAPLPPDRAWRNAVYDLKSWASLLPEQVDELERDGRSGTLVLPTRIEVVGASAAPNDAGAPAKPSAALPEHALVPRRSPLRRDFYTPAFLGRGFGLPPSALTPLAGTTRLAVEARGPRARRLELTYRADPTALGGMAQLVVNGATVREQPLMLETGTLTHEVEPGAHEVALLGLGAGGVAFARAAPADGGAVALRHAVFELAAGDSLELPFRRNEAETPSIVLFVITEGADRAFRLDYRVDGGVVVPRAGAFFRRTTAPLGTLEGRGGERGHGLLWESRRAADAPRFPDGVARFAIRLGDDLEPGAHSLRIARPRDQSPENGDRGAVERIFVRAVLVGHSERDSDADGIRWWTAEGW